MATYLKLYFVIFSLISFNSMTINFCKSTKTNNAYQRFVNHR